MSKHSVDTQEEILQEPEDPYRFFRDIVKHNYVYIITVNSNSIIYKYTLPNGNALLSKAIIKNTEAMQVLCEALQVNNSLKLLEFKTQQEVERFADTLKTHPSITALRFYDCEAIGEEALSCLVELAATNYNIREIGFYKSKWCYGRVTYEPKPYPQIELHLKNNYEKFEAVTNAFIAYIKYQFALENIEQESPPLTAEQIHYYNTYLTPKDTNNSLVNFVLCFRFFINESHISEFENKLQQINVDLDSASNVINTYIEENYNVDNLGDLIL